MIAAFCLVISLGCVKASAYETNAELIQSGPCGENLTYSFYADGTLVISGTGEMNDYSVRKIESDW